MGCLKLLRPMPMINLSNNGSALSIISVCPSVTGSNVPGKRQMRSTCLIFIFVLNPTSVFHSIIVASHSCTFSSTFINQIQFTQELLTKINYDSLPDNKYNTAIRTATPFSTCCKIIELLLSATSLSISTPRLIGPGCIITISLLILSSNFLLTP